MQYLRAFLLVLLCLAYPISHAAPIKSMVVFGDSLSDNGNTAKLFKTLRHERDPAYLVEPLQAYFDYQLDHYGKKHPGIKKITDLTKYYIHKVLRFYVAEWLTQLTANLADIPILPPPPYWQHRFTDGKVWNEYLALQLGLNPLDKSQYYNYAFGGSWASMVDPYFSWRQFIKHPKKQLKKIISGKLIPPSFAITSTNYVMRHPKINPETVFFIFYGGNDYLNALSHDKNYNLATLNRYVNNVVNNIVSGIKHLYRHGARRFVVLGLPHIGNTPRYLDTPEQTLLNQAVDWHNDALAHKIREIEAAQAKFVNIAEIFAHLVLNANKHGMTETTKACTDATIFVPGDHFIEETHEFFADNILLNQIAALGKKIQDTYNNGFIDHAPYYVCTNPENHVFWDEVHPTTTAHELLANEIRRAIT